MLNNRKLICILQNKVECLENSVEVKENTVLNLLDANKEFAIANQEQEKEIYRLKMALKKEQEINCELMQKNAKLAGKLDKIENYYRVTEGREFI